MKTYSLTASQKLVLLWLHTRQTPQWKLPVGLASSVAPLEKAHPELLVVELRRPTARHSKERKVYSLAHDGVMYLQSKGLIA